MKIILEDIIHQGINRFLNRIPGSVTTLKVTETEPSVKANTIFIGCGSLVTITNFLGGTDGTSIKVLGDGFTTIDNNTAIATNTGAAKLLAANKMYTFSYIDSLKKWYENA